MQARLLHCWKLPLRNAKIMQRCLERHRFGGCGASPYALVVSERSNFGQVPLVLHCKQSRSISFATSFLHSLFRLALAYQVSHVHSDNDSPWRDPLLYLQDHKAILNSGVGVYWNMGIYRYVAICFEDFMAQFFPKDQEIRHQF